jgi:hypothetical protein
MSGGPIGRTVLASTIVLALLALSPSALATPAHSGPALPGVASGAAPLASPGARVTPSATSYANCGATLTLYLCIGTSASAGSLTPTTSFTPSSIGADNRIFFSLCDALDVHTANITIQDQNASRDGVSAPAFSELLSIGPQAGSGCPGSSDDSAQLVSYLYYQIPANLALGGAWTFNVTTDVALDHWQQVIFHVHTYYVTLGGDQLYHLPGDTATVYYQVISYESEGPISQAPTFTVRGLYTNNSTTFSRVPLPPIAVPTSSPQGSFTFGLPDDAVPGTTASIRVWANLTTSSEPNSEVATVTFDVDQMVVPALCAATTTNGGPTPCVLTPPLSFPEGSQLVLRQVAWMGNAPGIEDQTIPDATVTLQLVNPSDGWVPISTSLPSPVSTDSAGAAREVLNTAGLGAITIELNVTVFDPSNAHLYSKASLNITLTSPLPVAVQIALNETQYFGGDVVGGTYQIVSPGGNGTVPPYWSAYAYAIYFLAGGSTCPGGPSGQVEIAGNLTGASGKLPASFTTGLAMSGLIEVVVYAHNGSSSTILGISSIACALVSPPQIAVNPSEVNYLPGDTISVTITPEGSVLSKAGTTYFANVVGYATVTSSSPCSGTTAQVLFGAPLSGTTFSFKVPTEGTSLCYELSVSAQTANGIVTGEDVALTEVSGYTLAIAVTTVSQYSDGSYQPGESLTVSYQVSPIGTATVPVEVTLYVYAGNLPTQRIQQASPSGDLTVTIPGGQGAGIFLITVQASVPNPVSGTALVQALTGVDVEPHPSILGLELGPGSAFTVGELIIVAIIAALVIVGVLLWRRSRWESYRTHIREEHPPVESASAADSGTPPSSDEVAPAPSTGGSPPLPPPSDAMFPSPPPPPPPPPPSSSW